MHPFSTVRMVTGDYSEKPTAVHNRQGKKRENMICSKHSGNLRKEERRKHKKAFAPLGGTKALKIMVIPRGLEPLLPT